jgi:hypothetical protein
MRMIKYKFKYNFVIASIIGCILVGSINNYFRIWGFLLATIGNVYWIWYHKSITEDKEMLWIFIAYFFINSLAIINNYYNGCFVW